MSPGIVRSLLGMPKLSPVDKHCSRAREEMDMIPVADQGDLANGPTYGPVSYTRAEERQRL